MNHFGKDLMILIYLMTINGSIKLSWFIGSGVFTVYGGKVVSILLILDIFKVIVAMRLYGDFFLLLNYMGNRSTLT